MLSLKYFGFCQNDSNQCPYLFINYNKELRTLLVAFVLGRMWTLNSEHPHFKIAWCSHTMGVRFTPHLGWKQDDLQNLPRCGFKSPTIWQKSCHVVQHLSKLQKINFTKFTKCKQLCTKWLYKSWLWVFIAMHKAFQDTVLHKSLKYEIHEICTSFCSRENILLHTWWWHWWWQMYMDPSTVENQYLLCFSVFSVQNVPHEPQARV